MKLDIDKYKLNRVFVQEWYLKNKDNTSIGMSISMMACSTMCPAVCVAYWIGEVTDWHPEVIASINTLIKFYGYTEIFNKPEGSPV